MPKWFSKLTGKMTIPPYNPSSTHLNTERLNGFAEFAGASTQLLTSPTAVIPFKFGQVISSGYTLFAEKPCRPERGIHFLQAMIALCQLIMASMLFFQDEDCKNDEEILCKLLIYFSLLYDSTLAFGWGAGELSKQSEQPSSTPKISEIDEDEEKTDDDETAEESEVAVSSHDEEAMEERAPSSFSP
ncbi:hypothetical protein [Legionella spiritensis]|uniref:Uncharacterized protein n=1 Tax=Legionella spiritensis TaxID=452 RepID=A0A0W0YWD2_LEGSP|nr:hypothetical protein [Legionella spiritensis]KTD61216.1 hypothetical protein Lspi_2836 [Legionella spiritensis]SNV28163.1 Uncharacterised protein [Legionella spiritensis]